MASITIRNLDEGLKQRLRVRAAERGHSMEQEARRHPAGSAGADAADRRGAVPRDPRPVEPIGGIELDELEIPPRGPMREPPRFD